MSKLLLPLLVFIPCTLFGQSGNQDHDNFLVYETLNTIRIKSVAHDNGRIYIIHLEEVNPNEWCFVVQGFNETLVPLWNPLMIKINSSMTVGGTKKPVIAADGTLVFGGMARGPDGNWFDFLVGVKSSGELAFKLYSTDFVYDAYKTAWGNYSLDKNQTLYWSYIAYWTCNQNEYCSDIRVHKIDLSGEPIWQEPLKKTSNNPFFDDCWVLPQSNGGCMLLSYQSEEPGNFAIVKACLSLYDHAARLVWDKDVVIFERRRTSAGAHFHENSTRKGVKEDLFLAGYYLRRYNKNGYNILSEESGFAEPDDTIEQLAGFIHSVTSDNHAFIEFSKGSASPYAPCPIVFGQLLTDQGEKLWGDYGIPLYHTDSLARRSSVYRANGNDIYQFFDKPLSCIGYDLNGTKKPFISVQINQTANSSHISDFYNDQCIIVWPDTSENGQNQIRSQVLHADGSLGLKTGKTNLIDSIENIFVGFDSGNNLLCFKASPKRLHVRLFNLSGKIVYENIVSNEIHLPMLPAGVYFLSVFGINHSEAHRLFLGRE